MKGMLLFSACAMLLVSCHDKPGPTPTPVMKYIDLKNAEVVRGQSQRLDLDNDGVRDFGFGTMLVGDPVLKQDRLVYFGSSGEHHYLIIDNTEYSVKLNKGEKIASTAPQGYNWFDFGFVVLTEKITPETGSEYWRGLYTDADHHYLPVQISRNGFRYNGWIELSMNTIAGKLILHRAAISTEAAKEVIAGL